MRTNRDENTFSSFHLCFEAGQRIRRELVRDNLELQLKTAVERQTNKLIEGGVIVLQCSPQGYKLSTEFCECHVSIHY